MSTRESIIQTYLDAISDHSCFCRGDPRNFRVGPRTIRPGPTCAVRDSCPLFRNPDHYSASGIKMYDAVGDPDKGCDAFVFWEQDKLRQEEDAREWVVTMAGVTRICHGRDAQMAAVRMFLQLHADGVPVDKMDLLEKRYSVRET